MDWGKLINSIAPAMVGLGVTLITNNQAKQNAQGQAEAEQQALNIAYETAQTNQENIKLMSELNKKASATPAKSNTALYIGLGVGGVVLLGVVVFAVTRK